MLKSAILYKDNILTEYAKHIYDLDYQFFFGWQGTSLPDITNNTYDCHQFASVDKNNNVIGYITYTTHTAPNNCDKLGIISFNRGNITFIRDVKQAIDDIFFKYNFNKLNFVCYEGNPILKSYRKFIKKHGGREVGYYKDDIKTLDGKLRDCYLFEIMKSEYKK